MTTPPQQYIVYEDTEEIISFPRLQDEIDEEYDGMFGNEHETASTMTPKRETACLVDSVDLWAYQSIQPSLPEMRSYIQAPSILRVPQSTPEAVDCSYVYNNYPVDYGGQIKNDLNMYLAEMALSIMTETPEEEVRAFPRRLRNILRSLETKPLANVNDAQTDVLSSSQFQEQLKNTQLPFLLTASCYDLGFVPMEPLTWYMLQTAYSILRELNIDTRNPFLINPEDLIPQQSLYRLGTFRQLPFKGLLKLFPIGDMGMPQELYCLAPDGPIWPVRSLVKARNAYIKPCFLPHRRYSLFGLEKVLYSNAEPIVVTPDLTEYLINSSYANAVISWYGAQYTLPKVDFSPLAGRSVIYVFNPGSFNGDYQACLHCMNQVVGLLANNGCNVDFMANPVFSNTPNPQLPPPTVCTADPINPFI